MLRILSGTGPSIVIAVMIILLFASQSDECDSSVTVHGNKVLRNGVQQSVLDVQNPSHDREPLRTIRY